MTDREQTRRDAEITADDPKVSATASVWAHKCLALLAELEQAEQERDEARKLAAEYEAWLSEALDELGYDTVFQIQKIKGAREQE